MPLTDHEYSLHVTTVPSPAKSGVATRSPVRGQHGGVQGDDGDAKKGPVNTLTPTQLSRLTEGEQIKMAMRASIAENEETQAEIKEATTRLEEMVAKDNRALVEVPRDGNCQMKALIETYKNTTGLEPKFDTARVLRVTMIEFMKHNQHRLSLELPGGRFVRGSEMESKKWSQYVKQYATSNVWGDGTTLQAAASILNVNVRVHVWSHDRTPYTHEVGPFDGDPEHTIVIACHGDRHYWGTSEKVLGPNKAQDQVTGKDDGGEGGGGAKGGNRNQDSDGVTDQDSVQELTKAFLRLRVQELTAEEERARWERRRLQRLQLAQAKLVWEIHSMIQMISIEMHKLERVSLLHTVDARTVTACKGIIEATNSLVQRKDTLGDDDQQAVKDLIVNLESVITGILDFDQIEIQMDQFDGSVKKVRDMLKFNAQAIQCLCTYRLSPGSTVGEMVDGWLKLLAAGNTTAVPSWAKKICIWATELQEKKVDVWPSPTQPMTPRAWIWAQALKNMSPVFWGSVTFHQWIIPTFIVENAVSDYLQNGVSTDARPCDRRVRSQCRDLLTIWIRALLHMRRHGQKLGGRDKDDSSFKEGSTLLVDCCSKLLDRCHHTDKLRTFACQVVADLSTISETVTAIDPATQVVGGCVVIVIAVCCARNT